MPLLGTSWEAESSHTFQYLGRFKLAFEGQGTLPYLPKAGLRSRRRLTAVQPLLQESARLREGGGLERLGSILERTVRTARVPHARAFLAFAGLAARLLVAFAAAAFATTL